MKARTWALLFGLLAVGTLLLFKWPSDCVGRAGPGPDPTEFYKICSTPLGSEVAWPYDSDTGGPGLSFHAGPTDPNWLQLSLEAIGIFLVVAIVTYVIARWRDDRFESVFAGS